MTNRAVMQQALECIERLNMRGFILADFEDEVESAITALREALAQPEQEPVAKVVSTAPDRIWLDLGFDPQDETEVLFGELHDVTWSADNASGYGIEYVRTTPPLPEQEPSEWRDMVVVTLVREGIDKHRARELADHFAAQPEQVDCPRCGHVCSQRPWVGLTPEEVQFCALKHRQLVNAHYDAASDTNIITATFEATVFYETVEQALKERNG